MTKQAYDEKNEQDYIKNTLAVETAIEQIRRDPKLKPTITQIHQLTGLNRKTIRDREPKEELEKIKSRRKVETQIEKEEKKDTAKELESQLDNAQKELVYWFNEAQSKELQLNQLEIKIKKKQESIDFYKTELERERLNNSALKTQLNQLKKLMEE
ncbi:hypothetical protein [Pseudoalteromonas gelatinilytica]